MTAASDASETTSLLGRARRVIPGGVNSPVRSFAAVGGDPIFVAAAEGAYLIGDDGTRYVDLIGGYGPMILGHGHPSVRRALREAVDTGVCFGTPTAAEVELAELVVSAVPSVEVVRLVNSGTEATMSALRLARAVTGRTKVIKFGGCYHGHADPFLVAAGSGAATLGVPSSPGVPAAVVEDTLTAPYNDLAAVEALFSRHGTSIATVIVEPIAGNMSLVPPVPGYLAGLRRLCDEHGALLIFDEVMTGFRVAWGGAQELLRVTPDLTTLGKVIGGGLPIGAYGGRAELMREIAPDGPVYQAGTLSGNPLAVAAGLTTLRELEDGGAYRALDGVGARLESALREAGTVPGVELRLHRVGSMLGVVFSSSEVISQEDVDRSDRELFAAVFHALLRRGVHVPPSPYETWFLSAAHDDELVDLIAEAFAGALDEAG